MFKFIVEIIDLLFPKYQNQQIIDDLDKYKIFKKFNLKKIDGAYVLCDYSDKLIKTVIKQAKYYSLC